MKKYSSNEFNFKSKDSVINELLSITCEIYQSVNYGLKVGAFVCLDKFTNFKDFWHKGLDYKFKQDGVMVNLLITLKDLSKTGFSLNIYIYIYIYIIYIYTCIYIYIYIYSNIYKYI